MQILYVRSKAGKIRKKCALKFAEDAGFRKF